MAADETEDRYRGLPAGLGERIDNLPQEPGVYLMRNRRAEVIYVGKAVNLRSRVRSYFGRGDGRAFVALLHKLLGDIEVILVRSEKEALLLEQQLIKEHRPRFNVIHRDDKSFITLALNTRHDWPRIEVTRTHQLQQDGPKPGHRYFGPFSSAAAVRATLRVLNHHFLLRTCTDHVLQNRERPCLEYQIGRCMAPCVYDVPGDVYRQHVDDAVLFLSGRRGALATELRRRMTEASDGLRFEEAARLRDQLVDVERTTEKQVMADATGQEDTDILGLWREGSTAAVGVLEARGGRVLGKDVLTYRDAELPDDELVLQVLDARYADVPGEDLPAAILVPAELPDDERAAREALLTERRGRRVEVHFPQRGDRRALLEIANRNARAALEEKAQQEATRRDAVERLTQRLGLGRRPTVMECFDISLFQGSAPVASQVTFVDGAPEKKRYRKYGVRTVEGTDDFAMMHEVLTRRLARGVTEGDLPDLVVIDGGRGQLNAALAAFRDAGVPTSALEATEQNAWVSDAGTPAWPDAQRWVEVVGLAKARTLKDGGRRGWAGRKRLVEDAPGGAERWEEGGEGGGSAHSPERVFLATAKDPVTLKPNSAELHLLTQLRDEAHRFAITFHRARRSKNTLRSSLDEVDGVGPARRKALLRHFGSLTALQEADVDTIAAAPGIPRPLAERIWEHFRK
ncbi:MAG: excinuclease ABC subunit UvrC [Deltaproteobacteria bacterium]|nr:excinuclease ABC subunit UvrC [Deltaproteobacteria bacterium]